LLLKRNIEKLPDTKLINSYKKTRDKSLVGELFERHTHFVFCVCMKYLKDEDKSRDAVMQIFEKLFDDLLKHDVENFKAWLHTVTKNHCLLQIRSEKTHKKYEAEIKKDHADVMESADNLYLDIENDKEIKLKYLEEAINDLGEEQQKCIDLFYLHEKCYNEVAEITGYSMKQVKSYIQNGKRNLKNYILNKYERQADENIL